MTSKKDIKEKKLKEKISVKWLYFAVILLAALFLFRLYDASQIIREFPLDQNNDLTSHIGELYFLKVYGFHANVPNWYNGFVLLREYPVGWFFFSLPIYYLVQSMQFLKVDSLIGIILQTAFISQILIYALGFLFIFLLGKYQKLSKTEKLFLYLVVFANPIAIGNFIKLGRLPELLSFVFTIPLFILILYFKENRINKYIILFAVLYSVVLLSHPAFFVIYLLFVISLLLIKTSKERVQIIISGLISVLFASFWLIPFLISSRKMSVGTDVAYTGLSRLLHFGTFLFDNIFSIFLPLIFFIVFYFYSISLDKEKRKKELLFYSPILIFAILYLFRIAAFIPVFNRAFPDSYNMLFIFLSMFLFLKTKYTKNTLLIIKIILILLPISFILASHFFVPYFRHNSSVDLQVLSLLPEIDGKFIIIDLPYPSSTEAFYSYSAIKYNLSTASGWNPVIKEKEYIRELELLKEYAQMPKPDCTNFNSLAQKLGIKEIIAYKLDCVKLKLCGYSEKIKTSEGLCLLEKVVMPQLKINQGP